MDNQRTSVYLPADLVERIKREAALSHRSFSGQVSFFLSISVARQAQEGAKVAQEG